MLSARDIERYRRMTPAERLRETLELCEVADRALAALAPAERARRLALVEAEHKASNAELFRGLAKAS